MDGDLPPSKSNNKKYENEDEKRTLGAKVRADQDKLKFDCGITKIEDEGKNKYVLPNVF